LNGYFEEVSGMGLLDFFVFLFKKGREGHSKRGKEFHLLKEFKKKKKINLLTKF